MSDSAMSRTAIGNAQNFGLQIKDALVAARRCGELVVCREILSQRPSVERYQGLWHLAWVH